MNCPHCDRILYSRQHKTCGFCGVELPAEYLLSQTEMAQLKTEQQALAERRVIAKEKDEEDKKRQTAKSEIYMPPIFYL